MDPLWFKAGVLSLSPDVHAKKMPSVERSPLRTLAVVSGILEIQRRSSFGSQREDSSNLKMEESQ